MTMRIERTCLAYVVLSLSFIIIFNILHGIFNIIYKVASILVCRAGNSYLIHHFLFDELADCLSAWRLLSIDVIIGNAYN